MPTLSLAQARQLASELLAAGDMAQADICLQAILSRYPRDYRTAILHGRLLLKQGNPAKAYLEFQRAAEADPESREARQGMAECGGEEGRVVLADLPPLTGADGARPPISAVALGHLYLRQLQLVHCTAQLGPLWQSHRQRLDIGVALAEAHWRLREPDAAERVCRQMLEVSSDCLKANLILAQQLHASGRRSEMEPLMEAARAVDADNAMAEELYEWLIVRDPEVVPLRFTAVEVEVPDGLPAPGPLPEPVAPPLESVIKWGASIPVGGGLGLIRRTPRPTPTPDLPRVAEPVAGGPEVVEAPPAASQDGHEPVSAAPELVAEERVGSANEPVPATPELATSQLQERAAATEPPAVSEPPELVAQETAGSANEPVSADPELSAGPMEASAMMEDLPDLSEPPELVAHEAAGSANEQVSATSELTTSQPEAEPARAALQQTPAETPELVVTGLAPAPIPASEPVSAAPELVAGRPEAPAAPDGPSMPPSVDQTAPEPAPAVIEESVQPVRIVELSPRGQVTAARLSPQAEHAWRSAATHLDQTMRQLGEAWQLGQVVTSSVETDRGAAQVLHDASGAGTLAVAPAGANLGQLRTAVRRGQHTS